MVKKRKYKRRIPVKRKARRKTTRKTKKKSSFWGKVYSRIKTYRAERKAKQTKTKRTLVRQRKPLKQSSSRGFTKRGQSTLGIRHKGHSLVGKDKKVLKSIRGTVKFKKNKEGRKISFKPYKKRDS